MAYDTAKTPSAEISEEIEPSIVSEKADLMVYYKKKAKALILEYDMTPSLVEEPSRGEVRRGCRIWDIEESNQVIVMAKFQREERVRGEGLLDSSRRPPDMDSTQEGV